MSVICYQKNFPKLSKSDLEDWADIPASVASDCLDRSQVMDSAIKPLADTMRIVGQARTVECMVADNSALHVAVDECDPGEVLVCDGKSYQGTALFGGLMAKSALYRGVAGLVIDGAVRDRLEIISSGFSCFARAVVPSGPHKNFGGKVGGTVSCGDISVSTGDLIIADADGVTVVPFARINETLKAARDVMAMEERALISLSEGEKLAKVFDVKDVVKLPLE